MKPFFFISVILLLVLGRVGTAQAALMYDFQVAGPDLVLVPYQDDGGTIILNASVLNPNLVSTTMMGLGNTGGPSILIDPGDTLTLSFADGVDRILQTVTFAGLGSDTFLEQFTLSANGSPVNVTSVNPIPVSGLVDFSSLGGIVGNTFFFGSLLAGGGNSSYRIAAATFTPVPAPSTVFFMATGLAAFLAWRKRRMP